MSEKEDSSLAARLDVLQSQSAALSPGPEQRKALLASAERLLDRFLPSLSTRAVYRPSDPETLAAEEALEPTESPADADEMFGLIERHVAQDGLHEGSPRFFGFIPGGGLYASAVADYVAAAINRYAGVGFAAPGAARLERRMVRWLSREVGYPADTSNGDLTSGGSIANLSAVVAARDAHNLRGNDIERTVVYVSEVTHHSCLKALAIAGLREAVVRQVACDDGWRMVPANLVELVRADREAGLQPWLIAANAGATDTGGVDPLAELASIARRENLWLHVDAAYGGAFALCEEGRRLLEGMQLADSITLDPHKGLFLPFGSGAVLIRDARHLYAANHVRGAYMQDLKDAADPADASPCDLSPELTRPFRALRLWLPLRLFGVAAFRAALEEKLLLARYAHSRLAELESIEMGPPPDLSIFVFRFVPPGADPEIFNAAFAEALRADGRIFLSSTNLAGRFMMRFAVLNYHSHRADVDAAVSAISEVASGLFTHRNQIDGCPEQE